MTTSPIDLTQAGAPWLQPAEHWRAQARATEHLDPPFAAVSREALAHNAHDMLRRANGTPIRVASKSIRSRDMLRALLALPGYAGILGFTLPEALWLADEFDDIVVAYPTADRAALARLAADEHAAARVTLMIDSVDHLDLIDAAVPRARASIRVALELDASWRGPLGHIGVRRSPVHEPVQLRRLAERVLERPGFTLVGVMAYEAQIAGVGDAPGGRLGRLRGAALSQMQRVSMRELVERRGEAVALVREIADLAFVNGGGTGSLEATAADPSVTEVAAGSGLFGPHLFDHYAGFTPAPAAAFALPVVRRPGPGIATLLGGGWIASGVAGPDRLPLPVWPAGLQLAAREGAGEVQTPVIGARADRLSLGDRVWMRHTKAGELSEHVDALHVVDASAAGGPAIVATALTYRGEGKVFA